MAYIALWAYDIAINNRNLPTPANVDRRSFGASPSQSFPNPLLHPVFATAGLVSWENDVKPMAAQIINSYAG
ncbi:hypothetical protein [Sinorhizobium fredii]|uniref:hypothetical protein n=1 Tax=Rhizobium fredii TaxID=380 RepID=UPI0004B5868B|nr:hypothetical protein [Sinorhizobium fredii]